MMDPQCWAASRERPGCVAPRLQEQLAAALEDIVALREQLTEARDALGAEEEQSAALRRVIAHPLRNKISDWWDRLDAIQLRLPVCPERDAILGIRDEMGTARWPRSAE